jgi:hypothetical protein
VANKELEIVVRAKDAATPVLDRVGKSAKDAAKGLGGLADSLKGARKEGINELFEEFSKTARGLGAAAFAVEAISKVTSAITTYKQAVYETGSRSIAKVLALEEFAHAIPITSQIFDFLQAVSGGQSVRDMLSQAEASKQAAIGVTQLAFAYSALNKQAIASRPGQSDATKFTAGNLGQLDAGLGDITLKRAEIGEKASTLKKALLTLAGDGLIQGPEYQTKSAELKHLQDQLSWLDKLEKKYQEIASNNQQEYNRKDTLRQQDARLQGELRVAKIISETRRAEFAEYGQQLQADLEALRQQTDERVKLIQQAAIKEREGKTKGEQQEIDARAKREAEAVKRQANQQADLLRRADGERKNEDFKARRGVALDDASKYRGIVIDSLEQQASLGDYNAKLEAERLKITDQFIAKRRELQDILENPNASREDKNAASSFLGLLGGEEERRKAAVGLQGTFVGSTAASQSSYFTSGVAEGSRERQIFNPLLAEQKKATEAFKAAAKGIEEFLKKFDDAPKLVAVKLNK